MPTLCTGGMGIPAHIVAVAAVRAAHLDFIEHPTDPIRVRVACFDPRHMRAFLTIKDDVLQHFFRPDEAERTVRAPL
eukprot:CAMPEP_0117593672 /NCGR_PEP_ID=MMETSP0784-20121206/72767_1 /TAXON_ID=39447 /ORGANISM="" /LENGTH=76 /DNA_ID=CAMNT_0005395629 /DNA_START=48 /DNA_END=275 /DNA_ORIENTATION=+